MRDRTSTWEAKLVGAGCTRRKQGQKMTELELLGNTLRPLSHTVIFFFFLIAAKLIFSSAFQNFLSKKETKILSKQNLLLLGATGDKFVAFDFRKILGFPI